MFIALFCLSLLWWPMGLLVLFNLSTVRQVSTLPLPPEGEFEWPALTIIAPARNEATHLEDAIHKRLQTTYPNLQLLLIDDRSEDDTGAIADRIAAEDERLHILHNETLPEGWLGKVHVLELGTQAAQTEWLLFSDADVEISPETLKRTIYHAQTHALDVLAAMPTLQPAGLLLNALHAVFLRVLYAAFIVKLVENPRSSYGVGVGAFTLVRRSALLASPGFAHLRLEVADDLMLGRMLKQAGARCTILNGAHAISVDIYPTPRDFVLGAEKNAWAVSAQFSLLRGLASACMLLLLDLSPLLLLLAWHRPLLWSYAVCCTLWATGISMFSLAQNGRSALGGLFYPFGTLLFVFAALRGTLLGWWQGGLQWRGTFYPTPLFLEFIRNKKQK